MKSVTETIERALAAAGLPQLRRASTTETVAPAHGPMQRQAHGLTESPAGVGQFLSLSHAGEAGSRDYKLYVPSGYDTKPAALIVMLHGCKQSPDDFARGTRMNALAERHGFLVAYPAQTARANGANCWNWFERDEQRREGTEPSLIAGIVRDVARAYALDTSSVFVAGLSAGAAMAVILGATYPELFAGVAAHSGLPMGAAHDVASAFGAMRGRATSTPDAGSQGGAVPTIVFHGDSDHTVACANGKAIVEQALQGYAASNETLNKRQRQAASTRGNQISTTEYLDAEGRCRVEDWVVQGGAHAWFGGSAEGSYTQPAGPDASAEMVRFFLSQKS